jgi:hypothetical protein
VCEIIIQLLKLLNQSLRLTPQISSACLSPQLSSEQAQVKRLRSDAQMSIKGMMFTVWSIRQDIILY